MRPKFQADNDLNGIIVSALKRKVPEIDLQTAYEAQLDGVPDDDVLALAAREGRILITHDKKTLPRHFKEFIKQHKSPGLIVLAKRVSFTIAIDEIILTWAASSAEEYENVITWLPR